MKHIAVIWDEGIHMVHEPDEAGDDPMDYRDKVILWQSREIEKLKNKKKCVKCTTCQNLDHEMGPISMD